MPSSEPAIATYAFPQLDAPEPVAVGAIGDVLSRARAEADQLRDAARAQGEAEGRALAIEAVRAEAVPLLEALAEAAGELAALRTELVAALEQDAAQLALAIAEHVVAGALAVEPERLIDVARGALRRLAERHRVTLIVNPGDLELLGGATAGLITELGGIEHLDVQSDRRIGRGGVIARTESGEIDASTTAQLERAQEVVMSALSGEHGDA